MRRVTALGLVLLAAGAGAHWTSPDEIVAALMAPGARVATGVERAEVDAKNARVLLVWVGRGWSQLPADLRTTTAAQWRVSWRQTVPQGVVAVLDARTEEPVVHYGPGGAIVGLGDTK